MDWEIPELDNEGNHARLSRIETHWSVIRRANVSDREIASSAKHDLIGRYGGAIRNYLGGALKNDDIANELYQDFVLKFLAGELKNISPDKGRFRSFVKTVLFRMVAYHFRKLSTDKVKNVIPLADFEAVAPPNEEDNNDFLIAWRSEILKRTWEELAALEMEGGPNYYSVLTSKVENPLAESEELAEIISSITGKQITQGNARVLVHRSRDKFANLMLQSISESLENPTRDAVESELIDLGLIEFCRGAIDGYKKFSPEA